MIVAEAADGRECIQLAEEHSPDVVMMDIAMPKMNGIEATRRILAANPSAGVVILSMHQDESYVLQSLKAGAKGYLLKDSPREDILEAIRSVADGRAFLSRKVSRMLQEDHIEQLRSKGLDDTLRSADGSRAGDSAVARGRPGKQGSGQLSQYQPHHSGDASRPHPEETIAAWHRGSDSLRGAQENHLLIFARLNDFSKR